MQLINQIELGLLVHFRSRQPKGVPCCQFHQHLLAAFAPSSFCQKNTNLSRKYKKAAQKALVRKRCTLNVGEIDTPVVNRHSVRISFDSVLFESEQNS